jgi:CHASE3 domain sensor protein
MSENKIENTHFVYCLLFIVCCFAKYYSNQPINQSTNQPINQSTNQPKQTPSLLK